MAEMTNERLVNLVGQMIKDCENYRDQLAVDRIKAMEYYDGEMKDVPVEDNRSRVVSKDVQSAIKKVLPSVTRILLGNDKVVEYEPVGEGDEEKAEQASDYINYVVFPESDGYDAVQDAIHDALKLRNGIIRWWYDKRIQVQVSSHSGLDEAAMVQLVKDDDVEVLEQGSEEKQVDGPDGPTLETFYDLKIRRRAELCRTRLAAVPLEEFLIHPDALDIEESPITGINQRLRRSDLVAMGYDRKKIDAMPVSGSDDDKEVEEFTRRRDVLDEDDSTQRALQEIEYYELYVRVDFDDDGIAELRRLVFAGGYKAKNLLENEEWDEVPFADIIAERRPHQREGNSVTDDMKEIQKIKTVLLRQTLDNLYWQNMPQPIVQEGTISNPEAVLNPKFGLPIRVTQGTDVRQALGFNSVPFVAKDSFAMLEYMDAEASDRTGINDASGGLPPDALQNMTATASAMIEQAGIGQTELMVRTIARGLKRVFQGLLRLTVKHQDKPRTVRLRDKWVTFDPREWNAEMDATVNTGLGAGTRERDMMMMQLIIQTQEKLLAGLGPDNPFVKPDNVYNAVAKLTESAGARSPELYFTKPDPAEIQQKLAAQANQPNPDVIKVQAQAEAQKQKAALDAQIKQEQNQTDAQLEMERLNREFALKQEQLNRELELKRQQLIAELNLKRQQSEAQIVMNAQVTNARTSQVEVGGEPG
ncbi:phage portal protein [Rhizobium sp. NZLR11]|uniref:portal protein n=1 Tax=Rhizobium sp. NZLR11 TaxID=2731098 RepID=UPI001C83B143|nr:phage portal protein [Rhizobium sp. NZLR11]MBX5206698.1 phage portal protein [Rhizobium sp. NZLR11]